MDVFLVDCHDGSVVKNPPAMQEKQVQSLGKEYPLEEEMATHSSILAWRMHGQRSLAGCSPWGHKESYIAEVAERAHDLHHL